MPPNHAVGEIITTDNLKLSVIDNDKDFAEKRRQFYEKHYRVAEPIDEWHLYAQEIVHSTTRDWFLEHGRQLGVRILNVGSGGSDYGIGLPMVHLDLREESICRFPDFVVADISSIPKGDASFDVILCVGSVLNYCNPILGIREVCRVLRPGGLLIMEYERSGSAELRKFGHSLACSRVQTFYGSVNTQLWVYGDQFVDGLLALHGLKLIQEKHFHGLSSLVLAVTKSPQLATKFVIADKYLANCWPIRNISSNRILVLKKLAH